MKRVLSLVSTLGIFTSLTTGILASAPESASALCVKNYTGGPIIAHDGAVNPYLLQSGGNLEWGGERIVWRKYMQPDEKLCCNAGEGTCPEAEVWIHSVHGSKGNGNCKRHHHNALVEVRYKDFQMTCNVIR